MKTGAMLLCGLFVVITAVADPYVISKQQARRAADQASADPQTSPPKIATPLRGGRYAITPTVAPAPTAAPTDPALAATLQNINDLRADLEALNAITNAETAAALKVSLLTHLSVAASGTKPSEASVKTLADRVIAATTGKKTPAAQQTKLARYLHAAFNGAHLTAAQLTTILNDSQKIMTSAGASADDAGSVVADLKAIAAETK